MDFSAMVTRVSNAMLNLGIRPQEALGVFSQNCIEYLYTDFGAYGIRAVTVPFYATSSEQQIQHMVNDAHIRYIFVGEQDQYDKAHRIFSLCPTLERIIIYDGSVRISSHDPNAIYFSDFLRLGDGNPRQSELDALYGQANDDDLCNILYTSGTTGDSKGVMLTHGQYKAGIQANDKCVPVGESDRVISFLPFTHIFERAWAYLSLAEGAQLIINTYPKEIQESMRQTHPTCMSSVPRFWEKVYQAVQDKMDSAGVVQQKLFRRALRIGHKYNVECLSRGKRPSLALTLEYKMVDKTILALVRRQLGLTKPNIFPTAGAYVSPEVQDFVLSVGLKMIVGYGLTESLATVSCNHIDKPITIGSVGRIIEGLSIKIGANDEILLKGPTITKGYYQRENITKDAFDADGYFHTGDAGYIKDGELFLTERIKDLFKTSNGKYIAPQMVEATFLVDKFVEQIVIVADQRKFVSALIVPDFRLLEQWATDHNIAFASTEELCANKKVNKMMKDRIDTLQQALAGYEQVKRFTLVPHHFDMESGEMTNTLKLRRAVIYKNYKDVIDAMYVEDANG